MYLAAVRASCRMSAWRCGTWPMRRALADGLSRALATPRVLVHDRGRVTVDLACAIVVGARVIFDFRVMAYH
jgi:uncharacterized protein (DUF2336 family)